MYCKNCGKEIDSDAVMCRNCGVPTEKGNRFCPNCGVEHSPDDVSCVNCGISFFPEVPVGPKVRVLAGVLGIIFGGFGIHSFYLGFTVKGILQIVVTILTCGVGSIWGFIEGILILCGRINRDSKGNYLK